jgi:hypothetical protein
MQVQLLHQARSTVPQARRALCSQRKIGHFRVRMAVETFEPSLRGRVCVLCDRCAAALAQQLLACNLDSLLEVLAAMTSRRRGRSEFEDDDAADSSGVSLSARPTRRAALEGDRERRDRFVPVRSAMDMATGSYLVTKENAEAGEGSDAVSSSKGGSSGLDAASTEAFNLALEASLLGGAAGGSAGEFCSVALLKALQYCRQSCLLKLLFHLTPATVIHNLGMLQQCAASCTIAHAPSVFVSEHFIDSLNKSEAAYAIHRHTNMFPFWFVICRQ